MTGNSVLGVQALTKDTDMSSSPNFVYMETLDKVAAEFCYHVHGTFGSDFNLVVW